MIEIYTDGACTGNGKKDAVGGGSYVAVGQNGESLKIHYFGRVNTTNQRMELEAAALACEWAADNFPMESVVIYSDSAYLINCVKQNWWKSWEKNEWKNSKKEPVANPDLWKRLIPFFDHCNFSFVKVKGHVGVLGNEMADKFAVLGKNKSIELGENYESCNC